MLEENDFQGIAPHFYSTSNAGAAGPAIGGARYPLKDAQRVQSLAAMDIIITCQGGDYTKAIYPALKASGWQGYWIDAASALRMDKDSALCLTRLTAPKLIRRSVTALNYSLAATVRLR